MNELTRGEIELVGTDLIMRGLVYFEEVPIDEVSDDEINQILNQLKNIRAAVYHIQDNNAYCSLITQINIVEEKFTTKK